MKSLLIVFFIVLFLIMILLFPFKVKIMFHIDLISMKFFYCFKAWRIKFLCGRAKINDTKEIVIENSDNLMSLKLDNNFMMILLKQLLKRIKLKKVDLYFTNGFVDDSYASALVCGCVLAITKAAYSVFSQIYEDVKVYEDISATFDETNFELSLRVVLNVSLISILISLIKADRIKNKKEAKHEK